MEKQLNSLGKTIYNTKENSKLDKAVKKLLSHKPVLAYILKYAVFDFAKYSIEEIIPMIDKVHVSTVLMEPGSTNDMITGELKDSEEVGEGSVFYDIRFFATLPGKDESTEYNVIIDVEAQAKQNESYEVETRGVAYCGRLLSEQIGRNVKNSHYENMQKVYSIWICMNCTQKDANTISEYGIREVNQVGNYSGHPRVDLLSLVMIRLPKDDEWDKAKSPATKLTEMLSTLLSNKIEPERKIDALENKFGIEATEEIRQEVNDMCNYSSAIRSEGYNEGADAANEATAIRMIKAGKYGTEEISEMSGVSVKRVEELQKKVKGEPVMA